MSISDLAGKTIVLGSRSPRRRELLERLYPVARIEIIPPDDPEELSFDGIHSLEGIQQQIQRISRLKNENVVRQCKEQTYDYLLTADTVIVVEPTENHYLVLGQPPETDYASTTKFWFENYYLGKSHLAISAICLRNKCQSLFEKLVFTTVEMNQSGSTWVDWYLQTDEPRGKAGGYAIQGLGSLFISQVTGSLSNVVGLPLLETQQLFDRATDQTAG
ncbi:MAG TPA: hypothetical protein DIW81_23795 [Planctomycetaceae bacterium]|nr:hypothetical protein [Planctomycetaceae bacterium]